MNFLRGSLFSFIIITAFLHQGDSRLAVSNIIDYSVRQYAILSERILGEDQFISTGDPLKPTWNLKNVDDWTVGFYGGSLWMLFKLTGDNYWKNLALEYQDRVSVRQNDTGTHDVGFVIMSTWGLGLELTGDKTFEPVIIQAAKSLATRFVRPAGVLRSWNNGEPGEVTVIADNMMNLELLLVASKLSNNNPNHTDIVISHSQKTREAHFRSDGSVFHVVAFNDTNGSVVRKYNVQGYEDNSAWSRGLSWVIHGFTTVYENIQNVANPEFFLESAELAAEYFINNLPEEDYVPYYDFLAPISTTYVPRDTAAAAIAAHAFLKLYKITDNPVYFETAEKILESLITEKYRADGNPNYKLPAILTNGTVFFLQNDFNTAIVYADFYFLRAIDVYAEITAPNVKFYN